MELRHLRYFCAVAELRNFTLAARQLNVSQSGVSGQVRDLEKEIGVDLLRRNRREVALTPQGSVFFDEARDILQRADRAVELVVRSSKGQSGKLTVGLCGPVTALFLPKTIRMFRREFPGVSLALRERAPSAQVEALLNGEIDIAFTRSISSEVRHLLGQELLFREPVILALAKDHPLAKEEAIPLKRLASERIILFNRAGAPEVFDAIVAMCRKAKFSPKIADTPPSWQSVLMMVESNEGVGLVPECLKHLKGNNIVFRPISGGQCKLDALVTWRRNEPNVPQESFLKLLKANRDEYTASLSARPTPSDHSRAVR